MLPEGWVGRTNASAPEGYVKAERPADWSLLNIEAKYDPSALGGDDGGVPIGWGKRGNASTLDELAQSTSAATIAVAEVHDSAKPHDGLFASASLRSFAGALENKSETTESQLRAITAQLESMHNVLSTLSGVVIRMDNKISELGEQQKLIMAAMQAGRPLGP